MNFIQKDSLPKSLARLEKNGYKPINGLYAIGDQKLLNMPKVAIVGSRKASIYTKELVSNLAKTLCDAQICVVSGGAIGVDIIAHKAAMPHTIAVFASGLDIIYPQSNTMTIRQIYDQGLALSQYPAGTRPFRHHFLERNKIVVGLCNALVLAQADINSGSMSSANVALKIGVPVYVLPQRLNESRGTNLLLEEQKASLITDFDKFAAKFSETKSPKSHILGDEILDFCKNGVGLDKAIEKFGDKIYEYELLGKLEIKNLRVFIA